MSVGRLNPFGGGFFPGGGGGLGGLLDPAGIFDKPKTIDPPPPLPPPVNRSDQAVQDARNKAIKDAKNRKGRKSTILTSGRGVSDDQLGVTRPEASSTLGG